MAQAPVSVEPARDVLRASQRVIEAHDSSLGFHLELDDNSILATASTSGQISKLFKLCNGNTLVVRMSAELRPQFKDIFPVTFNDAIPNIALIQVNGAVGRGNYMFVALVIDSTGIEKFLLVARTFPGRSITHAPPLPGFDRVARSDKFFMIKPDVTILPIIIKGSWQELHALYKSTTVPATTKFLSSLWLMCPWMRVWATSEFAVHDEPPNDVNWTIEDTIENPTEEDVTEFYCNLFYFSIGYLYSIGDNIIAQVSKRFNTALISSGSSIVSQATFNLAIVSKFDAGGQGDPLVTEALGHAVATSADGVHNQWVKKDELGTYTQLMGGTKFSGLDEQFFIQLRMVTTGFQQTSIGLVVSLLPLLEDIEKPSDGALKQEFNHAWGLKSALANRPYTNLVRNIDPNFQINTIPRLVTLAQAYYMKQAKSGDGKDTWSKFKCSESAAGRLDALEVATMKSLATSIPTIRLDELAKWARTMDPTLIKTIMANVAIDSKQLYEFMVKHGITGPWFVEYDGSEKRTYIKETLTAKMSDLLNSMDMGAKLSMAIHRDEGPAIDQTKNLLQAGARQVLTRLVAAYADKSHDKDPEIAAANSYFNELQARTKDGLFQVEAPNFETILDQIKTTKARQVAPEVNLVRTIPEYFNQFGRAPVQ